MNKILVITPFLPYPANEGQRIRTMQTQYYLKDSFDIVHLVHYAFEDRWQYSFNENDRSSTLNYCDEITHFMAQQGIGWPPNNGKHHLIDEWYDASFKEYIKRLTSKRFYDVVLIHNVWLSYLFEVIPDRSLQVLETHDSFSQRLNVYLSNNVNTDFFITTSEEEAKGISRANMVISMKEKERLLFMSLIKNFPSLTNNKPFFGITTLPVCFNDGSNNSNEKIHLPNPAFQNHKILKCGIIASSNKLNIRSVKLFLESLSECIASYKAPVELFLVGSICASSSQFSNYPFVHLYGRVDDIKNAYKLFDLVICPNDIGTGVKMKTGEAICHSKLLLSHSHSAEGYMIPSECIAKNFKELSLKLIKCAFDNSYYHKLCNLSAKSKKMQNLYHKKSLKRLTSSLLNWNFLVRIDINDNAINSSINCYLKYLAISTLSISRFAKVEIPKYEILPENFVRRLGSSFVPGSQVNSQQGLTASVMIINEFQTQIKFFRDDHSYGSILFINSAVSEYYGEDSFQELMVACDLNIGDIYSFKEDNDIIYHPINQLIEENSSTFRLFSQIVNVKGSKNLAELIKSIFMLWYSKFFKNLP